MAETARFGTAEEWRAHMTPAFSARSFHSMARRVADWTSRDYVTGAQRRELAELILRGGR